MQIHWFAGLFVLLLIAATLTRSWLNQRQVAAVLRHRDEVPEAFRAQIDLAAHQKAADYTVASAQIGRWDNLLDAAVALLLTLGGGLGAIDAWWQAAHLPAVWHGTVVVLSTFLLVSAIGLPLSIWRTFGVEARFGFNRTTVGAVPRRPAQGPRRQSAARRSARVRDPVPHAASRLAVVAVCLGRMGCVHVLVTWAYPTLIAPLFNKFTPLSDAALKERTEALLERCGFSSRGVFVMDGSRRSVHGNAYFTGVGRSKRIVFFDTLLERLQIAEVEAVLAHELGHFRLHHVRSRLLLSLAFGLIGLALLGVLAQWPDFYRALGVTTPSPHAALLLFVFVLPAFTYFTTPIAAWWSRKHEFEADEFASKFADASHLAEALVKLYRDNATTLTPDSLHSAFYDSHPPALVRISRLQQLAVRT